MKYRIFILSILLQFISTLAFAQDNPPIKNIFEKYGKQQGSVLLQLSSDVLSQGSNITFYKSLIVDETPQNNADILNKLKLDIDNRVIISETKKDGKTESGTYYLGKDQAGKNEYLLYKSKGKKTTLVYLRGSFGPESLEYELKRLKDLFIYVNNKRIKLQ